MGNAIGQTFKFNTGRHYDTWQTLNCTIVDIELYHDEDDLDGFFDITFHTLDVVDDSRGMKFRVVVSNIDLSSILSKYDTGKYEQI